MNGCTTELGFLGRYLILDGLSSSGITKAYSTLWLFNVAKWSSVIGRSSYIIYIFGSYQGDKTFRAAWKLLAPVTRMFILGPRAFLASTTTYENWITCLLFQKTKFRCQTNSYKQIENMQASLRLDKYGWEWDKIKRSGTEIPLKE